MNILTGYLVIAGGLTAGLRVVRGVVRGTARALAGDHRGALAEAAGGRVAPAVEAYREAGPLATGEAGCEERRRRVKQAGADLKLAGRLEKVRMDRAAFVAGEFATDTAERDYAAAFREAGLRPGLEETAERIR